MGIIGVKRVGEVVRALLGGGLRLSSTERLMC